MRPANQAVGTAIGFLCSNCLAGAISYSLYLVHNFNLRITEWASKFLFGLLGLASWESGIAFMQVVALILVGACFWFFSERPFLNRPVANT